MKCLIKSNTRLKGDYYKIVFAAPEIAAKAMPGSFVQVRIDERKDRILRRPFSIHNTDPASGEVEIVSATASPPARTMSSRSRSPAATARRRCICSKTTAGNRACSSSARAVPVI